MSVGALTTSLYSHLVPLFRKFNSTPVIYNGDPYLFMTEGSQCTPGIDKYASTAIHFVCDPAVTSEGNPKLVAQLPPDTSEPCAFFIEWRTNVSGACYPRIHCDCLGWSSCSSHVLRRSKRGPGDSSLSSLLCTCEDSISIWQLTIIPTAPVSSSRS